MKHTIIILVILLAGSVFSAPTGDTVRVPVDTVYGNIIASVYPDSVTCIPFTLSPYWKGTMINGSIVMQEVLAGCSWYVDTKGLNGTLHIQIKTTSNMSGMDYYDTTQTVFFYIYKLGIGTALMTSALHVAKTTFVHNFYFDFPFDFLMPKIAFSEGTPQFAGGWTYKTTGTVIITFTPNISSIQNRITVPTPSKTRNYDYKCYDILGRDIKNNFKTNLPYISKNHFFIKLK